MKFIGQYIQDFIARFRSDVYLEDISTGTIASGGNLGLDSNNKIVKNTVGGGGTTDLTSDVTGILPVANGGTGQNSLGSVNISDLNNDSGFTTNTGDIDRVTINTSSGSAQVTSGNADFTLSGTTPIGVTNSGTTITIAANDATTSNKGVAKFNASYFSVSSGNVSLADGAVDFSEDIITGTLPVGKGGTGVTSLGSINISSFNNDSGFTANTGDITGVTAGTNLSGGGSSGAVTINLADASESAKGAVELATTAETTTGTDTTRAVTPDGLKDGYRGSTNVTTLGIVTTGEWRGDVIDQAYLNGQSGINTGDEPDATTSTKGIASFNSGNFSVSSGAVDLASTISVGNVTVDDKIQHNGDTDTFIHFGNGGNDTITLTTGNVERLYITNSNTTFNETGSDIDFRVEANGEANALFVQGSDGNVGIGTNSPSEKLEVSGAVKVAGKVTNVTDPTSAQDAATKNYVDGKSAYQYISFVGNITANTNGNGYWEYPSPNGISNHTWTQIVQTKVDGTDNRDTTTVGDEVGIDRLNQGSAGIRIPYAGTIVGFTGSGRNASGNRAYYGGLFVGTPDWGTSNKIDAELVAVAQADASPGGNLQSRPAKVEDLSRSYSISAGDVIYPAIKGSGTNADVIQVSWTIVIKTPLV